MLRILFILGRVSNLPTVWTNVLAGWFLAGGGWAWELLWIEIGMSLLYVAGMTLNDAFDAKWDRKHAPERPIPAGAIRGRSVWLIGAIEMLAGVTLLLTMTEADFIWVGALAGAILLYDWIHKKTALAVVVMGACRGLVYLASASALMEMNEFPSLLWILVGAVILYVAGITVSARSERGPEAPRWEGWLGKALEYAPLFVLAAAPSQMATGWMRPTLWLVVLLFHLGWTGISLWLMKSDKGLAISLLIAGISIVDGAALVFGNPLAGAVCFALLPVTLLFQRYIPAT